MKSLVTAIVITVALVHQAHGQGTVVFDNISQGLAPVTINNAPGSFNPSDGPAGAYLGSNYTASLFFVNGTVTNQAVFDSLSPIWVADTLFFGSTGTGPGHGLDGDGSGFFYGGIVPVTGLTDLTVTFQVVAWYNGGGVYQSYAQALAAGHNVGSSNLLPEFVSLPPGPSMTLRGLQPFTVGIPEPSTLGLAALGGTVLLLFRRRK